MRAFLVLLISSLSFAAAEFQSLEMKFENRPRASIAKVEILNSKVIQEEGRTSKRLEIELGLTGEMSVCETANFVEHDVQSGRKPNLPSDHYFRVRTNRQSGCFTGSLQPVKVKTTLGLAVVPGFEAVHYLSFDAGMLEGHNRWKVYRLVFKDLTNVHLEYVKTVSFIQGQAVDKEPQLSIG